MSIVDSALERAEAEATLTGVSDESLTNDLRYWTVAGHDHAAEFNDLSRRRNDVQRLYLEASTWVELIAVELVRRRDARRASP